MLDLRFQILRIRFQGYVLILMKYFCMHDRLKKTTPVAMMKIIQFLN